MFSCLLRPDQFCCLRRSVITLKNVQGLKAIFGWKQDPLIIKDPQLYEFTFPGDDKQRRLKDAEIMSVVLRNIKPRICLEIGTGKGYSTALMALNAPEASIHTVNIPPEEFEAGGKLTTVKLQREETGSYYKNQPHCKNIRQIFANTAAWEPDMKPIDVAFIDGSHDTEFVINDTIKTIKNMRPGSFIMWHDFNPGLVNKFSWIKSVCLAIESLLQKGILKGKIYHVQRSWIGVYRIAE